MQILSNDSLKSLVGALDEKIGQEEELAELLNEYLAIQEDLQEIPRFKSKEDFASYFLSCFDNLPKSLAKQCKKSLFPYIRALPEVPFVESDPYYGVLKGLSLKENHLSLSMKKVRPGELFPYSGYEAGPSPYFEERPSFAYSLKGFSYPVFSKDGRPWMSLVPHEIKTMEKAIKECEGEVLTYGLGMGYFAYRACLKGNVSRLTVVESDPEILSFFKKHLLSSFPRGKLILIEGDALRYARSCPKGKYDYLFADIYHDAQDGLPLYIALKRCEGAAKSSEYWIEDDLLVYFRRYLIAYLLEQADPKSSGKGDGPYLEGSDFPSRLFRAIHFALKDRAIESESDVSYLLNDDSIKDLIVRMDIEN